MDVYYHGAWRMDWGLGNPNKTAVLIACLMIAVWSITYVWRRGFWLALPLFTVLGWCLVQTYSRGGMMALLAGVAVLLAWAPRPWPKARWLAVVAALWVIGAFVLYAEAGVRYGQGLFSDDQSINSRLVIWKHFPEMLAAAPWGWGWGKAGDSYTQWFQSSGQAMNYLNLINSHFTWMVEGGWVFSVLYIFAWGIVIYICWPGKGSALGAVPLAVWAALGMGACFSHVEDSPWLWILPLALLGFALWSRAALKQWPAPSGVICCAVFSSALVALLVAIGFCTVSLPLAATNGAVAIGQGPAIHVIMADRGVMGKLYGHALRNYLSEHRSELSENMFYITESPNGAMPDHASQTIISGSMMKSSAISDALKRSGQIILVNPGCFPEETSWDPNLASKTAVYFGEYSQSPSKSSWSSYPRVRMLIIAGAGEFIPSWPKVLWKTTGT